MGASSRGHKGRLWGASAAALLCLSLSLAASIGPAEADKVGVAAAVNPDAFSSLSGSPQSQLNIGKSIFFNERINTTTSGLVQVLLVDGSTFTVGPGSDLVIDKFVYDPKKQTGQIVASFSKGVMRFVGGKISKNEDGVTVNTPAGALAIRGGIAYVDFKSAKSFSILFVFGEYLKLQAARIHRFPARLRASIQPRRQVDDQAVQHGRHQRHHDRAHQWQYGGTGAAPRRHHWRAQAGANTRRSRRSACKTWSPTRLRRRSTTRCRKMRRPSRRRYRTPRRPTTPPPPPIPIPTANRSRCAMLTAARHLHGFPGFAKSYTTDNAGDQGILGGDDDPRRVTADDFIWTFDIVNDRLTGTVSGLTDSHCNQGDCGDIEPPPRHRYVVDFPGTLRLRAGTVSAPICPDDHATITQGEKTTTYEGLAVLREGLRRLSTHWHLRQI